MTVGLVDRVVEYGPSVLDARIKRAHRSMLRSIRGAGYWLWKPYIALDALKNLKDGDTLIYSDAGIVFVHSVHPLIELMNEHSLDVMVFENGLSEKAYTKRDAFVLMDSDEPVYRHSMQRMSGLFLMRKSTFAEKLAREWLAFAEDPRILTDRENELGLPDHTDFVAHRHDQSILSLLTKKYGVPGFRDPGSPEDGCDSSNKSPYPQIIEVTRRHNLSFIGDVFRKLRVDHLFNKARLFGER